MALRLSLLLIPLLLTLAGCSRLNSSPRVTPEMEMAVERVANQYTADIARGNLARAGEMVIWADYLASKKFQTTKPSILKQMEEIGKLPYENHPLRSLAVIRLDVRPETAEIELKKVDDENAKPFVVKLVWAGRGWLIAADTLLGPDGVLAQNQVPAEKGSAEQNIRAVR